jgi:hypothetical protein
MAERDHSESERLRQTSCSPVRTVPRIVGFKVHDSVSPTSVFNAGHDSPGPVAQPSPLSQALELPPFPRLSISTGKKKSKMALLKKSKSYADIAHCNADSTSTPVGLRADASLPSTPLSMSRASTPSEPMTIPYG